MPIATDSLWALVREMGYYFWGRKRLCFILGAGISVQSGIPSGEMLSKEWLDAYIHNEPVKAQNLINKYGINTENPGEFYSVIYKELYSSVPDVGYLCLQKAMDDKDGNKKSPSCGFYSLARILTETDSNLVITTNFDSLIEDSISNFTNKRSQIVIHEHLARYINVYGKNPVIVKLHRDLLFSPMSTPEDIQEIPDDLKDILKKELQNYIPIVIGYGGNDGSLMKFLSEEIADEGKKLYWCYYSPNGEPSEKIKETLKRFNTSLIPIDGFDEMMILLGQEFDYGKGDMVLASSAKKRIDVYNSQFDEVNRKLKEKMDKSDTEMPTPNALEKSYLQRIRQLDEAIASNDSNAENFYRRGKNYYAIGKYQEAVSDISKAIKLDQNNADYLHARCESYINFESNENALNLALSDINNAIELNNRNSTYYRTRATLNTIMGRTAEAEQDEAAARKLDPTRIIVGD